MKRVRVAIVMMFVVLAGVIGWQVLGRSDEPVYKGQKLSCWLGKYFTRVPNLNAVGMFSIERGYVNRESQEALRHIGTNAIPILLQLLRTKDSALKVNVMRFLERQHIIKSGSKPPEFWYCVARYGFNVLGTNAQSAVPVLIQIVNEDISPISRECAILSLREIGPSAKPAVPCLLQCATNADALTRCAVRGAISTIDPEAAKTGWLNEQP